MKIKLFEKEKHYDMVAHWWEQINRQPQPADTFPPTGLVIFDDEGNGLVAGWLLKTDGYYCIFEHFIGNLKADRKQRNRAVDMLINALEETARHMGYRTVFAFPQVEQLVKRALSHNYNVTFDNSKILTKVL